MPEGTPIPRQFFLVTNSGQFVIDWGNQRYQDIFTGDSVVLQSETVAFPVKESELVWLKNNGTISFFDRFVVYIYNLPSLFD